MADSIFQPMRFTIDLDSALVTQTGCGQLIYGDKSANVIEVKVHRGGKTIDLTGMTATGAFYRPVDGAEVPLPGAISANVVSVQLIDECYETEGHYEAEVKLSQGEVRRTILSIVGYVHRAGSGAVVNVTGVVPSIPELLAQISAMEAAAERANTAAARAEALAIDANGYAQNAKQLNGKDAKYYIQPIELLDNPEFAIAQAGYGGYHGNVKYPADRWYAEHGGGAMSVSRSNGITTLTNSAEGQLAMVCQKLSDEAMERISIGDPLTLAILSADGTVYVTNFNYQNPIDSPGINKGWSFNLYKDESDDRPRVRIYTGESIPISFKRIRLIHGTYTADNLPPYIPKGYAAELAECQRYFQYGYQGICRVAGVATTGQLYIRLQGQMRKAPTATLIKGGLILTESANPAVSNITNVSFASPFETGYLTITPASDFPAANWYTGYSWVNGKIELSADL